MRLMHGDCLELMKDIPDGSVDLTVTSPPYDNLRTYNGNNAQWGEHVWKSVLTDLYRVTKDGGVVVWVVADATIKGSETGTSFKQALWAIECGFNLHDTMIYEKNKAHVFDPRQRRYKHTAEFMFVFSRGKPRAFNPIMDLPVKGAGNIRKVSQRLPSGRIRNGRTVILGDWQARGSVWIYDGGMGKGTTDKIAYAHPAIFPEKLARDHIISWSNEGDTVFDPFLGSGTTGKAARQLNRNFIGIELDKEYFEIARQRIEAAQQTPVQAGFFTSKELVAA